MSRTRSRHWIMAGIVVLLGACLAGPARALPGAARVPLAVTGAEGLLAIHFRAEGVSAQAVSPRGGRKSVKALAGWSASMLRAQVATVLPDVQRADRATRLVNRLYGRALARRAGGGSGPVIKGVSSDRLSVLSLYAGVATAMSLDEPLSLELTVGGRPYSVSLDRRSKQATGGGASVQIDYTAPPAGGALNGGLFVALIREGGTPGVGVLVVGLFARELPDLLAGAGATNATQVVGTPVSVPFSLSLVGAWSGTHAANEASFDTLYFAVEDAVGIGVPEALAAQAAALLGQVAVEPAAPDAG
ncbi:MAG TPA: hypothetical protein VK689_02430 [Armatimonadota bacterium]|nr:hypothetical protein [Armatimonadota bacterium]